jgi:hypothetical protein
VLPLWCSLPSQAESARAKIVASADDLEKDQKGASCAAHAAFAVLYVLKIQVAGCKTPTRSEKDIQVEYGWWDTKPAWVERRN